VTGLSLRRFERCLTVACTALVAWLLWRDHTARYIWQREEVNVELGLWATRLLIATLSISPISMALREPGLKRCRRPLGLATACVTLVHTVQYLVYEEIVPDGLRVLLRPYLAFGVAALVLLLPLVATSSQAAVLRLGPRRWRGLHRLVYAVALLTLAHEVLAGTILVGEVGVHVVVVAGLLGLRLWIHRRRLRSWFAARAHPPPAPQPGPADPLPDGMPLKGPALPAADALAAPAEEPVELTRVRRA
jgi:sulfoxide reductase heme-binding subunit YedZ